MVQDHDRRVAAIPEDLCAAFNQEARQLNNELLTIYKIVAMMVRKMEVIEPDDLSKVAEAWGEMTAICDQASTRLSVLHKGHPYCGAQVYHDDVLDLRNKCRRLQQMHS
ncbi:MAG: hypothetical protein QOF48_4054 [Verrucomicrobiota bacterium]